ERASARSRTDDYNDGIVVQIESSHDATLRSAWFRACRFGRFGQPVQIVEAVMQVAAETVGGALVAEDFPDVLVVVERNQFRAADLFEKRRVLNFLERGDL